MGSSCSSAWKDFPNAIDRKIQTRGWNNRNGDWRTQAYNEGARAGMQEVLKEKEKQCFNDSATECIDLGNNAAKMIANKHCQMMAMYDNKNYRASCRDVAINQCKGQVSVEVQRFCGTTPSTNVLRDLMGQCDYQVHSLINGRSEDYESEYYDYSEDEEDLLFEH
jgi:arsenate reductase-like glutaredoxin family protein